MRLPIMYTMSWPERVPVQDATWPRLDFRKADKVGGWEGLLLGGSMGATLGCNKPPAMLRTNGGNPIY